MTTEEHFDEDNELTDDGGSELEPDNLVDLDDVYRGEGDYDKGSDTTEEDEDEEAEEAAEEEVEAEEEPPEEEAESLDVMLAREKVLDETQVARTADEARDNLTEPSQPMGDEEFTCRSCFLVKRRAQLANEDKLICFDCA